MHPAFVAMNAVELLPSARHADVAEAALLLDVFVRLERVGVREDALLHPRQEHDLELQPLGRVQGHQRHALLGLVAIEVGDERDGVEVVGQ